MSKSRFWWLLIILVALALRLYNLTYHSLWFDEAISVHWARQTAPRILEVGFTLEEDRLPPLYYLTLKGWAGLFGFSETGLRLLSVFYGVLLAPVMAGIARQLFQRRVALLTAWLVALNPFLIWYSQEVRMYAPAALFSALSVWAGLGMINSEGRIEKGEVQRRSGAETQRVHTPHPSAKPPRGMHRASGPGLPVGRATFYQLLFILFAAAALYSHLYAGFLLPALGLWLLISYPGNRRAWLRFAFSGVVITAAFAPLALAIWRFSGEATPGDPFSGLFERAWWLLQAFTVWKAPLPGWQQTLIPALILLYAGAAFIPQKISGLTPSTLRFTFYISRITPHVSPTSTKLPTPPHASSPPHPRLLAALLLLSPVLIANLLLARNYLAFFGERYFIVIVPWLFLLAAVGADRLSRLATSEWPAETALSPSHKEQRGAGAEKQGRVPTQYAIRTTPYAPRAMKAVSHPRGTPHASRLTLHSLLLPLQTIFAYLPALLLLAVSLLPLPGQWSLPAAKEFWRQSVAYLARHAAPDHAILIHPDWVRYPFQYYFRGPGQTYAAFSNVSPETGLDGPLQGVVGDHPVVWLIQSHTDGPDPNRLVEQWFAARYPLVTELYPPGLDLKGFAPGYQLSELPPAATPVDITFTGGLRLVGYQADPKVTATDEAFHPPSGWLHVTLFWTAHRPIEQEVDPFVHVVGPQGVWGVNLDRANDALKLLPPSHWPAGLIIRQDLDVNLNPVTPPGVYQVVVGLPGTAEQYPLTTVEIQ